MDKELDKLRCVNEELTKCDYCISKNNCDRQEELKEQHATSKEFKYRKW